MTSAQKRAMVALLAACEESERFGGEGWTKAAAMAVTKSERSSKNMIGLVHLGYVEARRKPGIGRQSQWLYRITARGRAKLQERSEQMTICLCGCEGPTKGGKFLPGHDQKLRAAIEAEVGGLESLRAIAEAHLGRQIVARKSSD